MAEISTITSRDNRRLVDIRKVREGKMPDRIFVEGVRLTEEALRSGIPLLESVVSSSFLENGRNSDVIQAMADRNVSLVETPDRLFSSLADTVSSQGVICIAERPASGPSRLAAATGSATGLFVFLQETNDPSNLGAVLRTAEAAGAAGAIISHGSADVFSPKALRAGMGSSFRLPIWDGAVLEESVAWARGLGIQVVAADISGKRSYSEVDWRRQSLVVFGSEAHGLGADQLRLADEIVTIPMQNDVESLNLAVSSGIILFEAVQQRLSTTEL